MTWTLKALGLLPRRHLSRWTGKVVHAERPAFLAGALKALLARLLKVPTDEGEKAFGLYPSFGAYFARRLPEGARVFQEGQLCSPCDGTLESWGRIESGMALQCKGRPYSIAELIGDPEVPATLEGGLYITIYLAPHNYHRVHWPMGGKVEWTRWLPGDLWPVNRLSVETVDRLFCINERSLSLWSSNKGKAVQVMVGATNVGSMDLAHLDEERQSILRSPRGGWVQHHDLEVNGGDEFGCFNMGSTVVLLLDASCSQDIVNLASGPVKAGQVLVEP